MENRTQNSSTQTPQAANEESAIEPASPHSSATPPGELPREIGGREGPEPTRFGDWEKNGRCIDF